jgi:hypothetical protein
LVGNGLVFVETVCPLHDPVWTYVPLWIILCDILLINTNG